MKNFNIQNLALMMMFVVVYTATTHPYHKKEPKLVFIAEEAQKMLDSNKTYNETVPKPSRNRTTCVKQFFCLAEKSLKTTRDLAHSNLTRYLHQYNKIDNGTVCHLGTSSTYTVKRLLEDIKDCANRRTL